MEVLKPWLHLGLFKVLLFSYTNHHLRIYNFFPVVLVGNPFLKVPVGFKKLVRFFRGGFGFAEGLGP